MRMLRRNKQKLWYANPTGWQYAVDENGFKTGEKEVSYAEPQEIRMSMNFVTMAGADGHGPNAILDPQGIVTGYSWTAITDDVDCPVNEESILWYGKEPWEVVPPEPEPAPEPEPEPDDGDEEGGDSTETDPETVPASGDEGGDGDEPEPEPEPVLRLTPHNLMVVRVVRSLNSVMYYLKEADVG